MAPLLFGLSVFGVEDGASKPVGILEFSAPEVTLTHTLTVALTL